MLAGPWVAAGVVPQQLCGDGTIVAEWTSGECGGERRWNALVGELSWSFFELRWLAIQEWKGFPRLNQRTRLWQLAPCVPTVWQGFSNPHGYSPKELGGYGSGTGSRVFADHKQPDVLMPPPPCAFKPPSCTPPRRYDTDIVARKPCRIAATPRQRHASPTGCYDTSMAYHVATTPTQRHASPAGRSDTGTACEPRRVATTPTQRFLPPPSTLLYTCTRLKPTSDMVIIVACAKPRAHADTEADAGLWLRRRAHILAASRSTPSRNNLALGSSWLQPSASTSSINENTE
ncbi:hypothetical protein EDB84DRAFT_1437386 [Lactarius hengduanensis]|nr:hypothetical protein EDB84DRAFT_1437386 [Lactarius hengduanensis]